MMTSDQPDSSRFASSFGGNPTASRSPYADVEDPDSVSGPLKVFTTQWRQVSLTYQRYLDRVAPFILKRWLGTASLLGLFMLRILFTQGWYIVCYALAIYLLNLLLAFLQPKFDPSLEADLAADEIEEGANRDPDLVETVLPSQRQKDDEFRPFVRRLPEWNFWLSSTRATAISLVCTFFSAFDIPVYWPILVIYFFILFALTMRRQIQHMIKYKYIPFDFGRKTRYGTK